MYMCIGMVIKINEECVRDVDGDGMRKLNLAMQNPRQKDPLINNCPIKNQSHPPAQPLSHDRRG